MASTWRGDDTYSKSPCFLRIVGDARATAATAAEVAAYCCKRRQAPRMYYTGIIIMRQNYQYFFAQFADSYFDLTLDVVK